MNLKSLLTPHLLLSAPFSTRRRMCGRNMTLGAEGRGRNTLAFAHQLWNVQFMNIRNYTIGIGRMQAEFRGDLRDIGRDVRVKRDELDCFGVFVQILLNPVIMSSTVNPVAHDSCCKKMFHTTFLTCRCASCTQWVILIFSWYGIKILS